MAHYYQILTLRYFTPEGELVPTPAEAAGKAENRVQRERQKAAN